MSSPKAVEPNNGSICTPTRIEELPFTSCMRIGKLKRVTKKGKPVVKAVLC